MALKPIPLTTDPSDSDSPKGAIPVDIHGGGVGERGPQGERGPEGPQGPAGADGAQGPEGPQGPAGADGAAGAKGDPGDDGADGFPSESDWNDLVARVEALEGE